MFITQHKQIVMFSNSKLNVLKKAGKVATGIGLEISVRPGRKFTRELLCSNALDRGAGSFLDLLAISVHFERFQSHLSAIWQVFRQFQRFYWRIEPLETQFLHLCGGAIGSCGMVDTLGKLSFGIKSLLLSANEAQGYKIKIWKGGLDRFEHRNA